MIKKQREILEQLYKRNTSVKAYKLAELAG